MATETAYAATFRKLQPNYDPRHIEGLVRLEYHTLSHLDIRTLRREAKIAAACIDMMGVADAEANAVSFGL